MTGVQTCALPICLIQLDVEAEPAQSLIHAVHLGQRGMRPAVRHLLDWLKQATENLR